MAENKTKSTTASVATFIAAIPDEVRRADARALVKLMQAASGEKPKMWGPAIVGFGSQHYVYDSGREGDIFEIGFASGAGGKGDISLYLSTGALPAEREDLLARLGKHRQGKGCVYVKRLSDVDLGVLEELCVAALREKRG